MNMNKKWYYTLLIRMALKLLEFNVSLEVKEEEKKKEEDEKTGKTNDTQDEKETGAGENGIFS